MAFRAPEILPFGTEILYDPYFSVIMNRKMDIHKKPDCSQKGTVLFYFEDSNTDEIVGLITMMKGLSEIIHFNGVEILDSSSTKSIEKQKYKTYVWKTCAVIPINTRILFDPFYDNNILNRKENRPNPLLNGVVQNYNSTTKVYNVSIVNSHTLIEVSGNAIAEAGADYTLILKKTYTIPVLIIIISVILLLFSIFYTILK
jgi:hypothetical protein